MDNTVAIVLVSHVQTLGLISMIAEWQGPSAYLFELLTGLALVDNLNVYTIQITIV